MTKRVASDSGFLFEASNGKSVRSLFNYCETCKQPLTDLDFETIALMPAQKRFDTIITSDCSRCVIAGLGAEGYQTDLSKFVDCIIREE